MKEKNKLNNFVFYAGILIFLSVVIFPFYWQLVTSFKSPGELWNIPPAWLPHEFHFQNYINIFRLHPFGIYLKNSVIVALSTTLFCLFVGTFAAYALAKLHFRGKSFILSTVLAVSMFPPIAIAPPLFLMLKKMHIINTYFALIFPYTTFALPFTLWNLVAFFRQIPDELQESAIVDGGTYFQIFRKIFLPLAAPGLFTSGILTFIAAWNEFLFALTFITSDNMRTVPVGIALFPGEYTSPWGEIAAATVVVTIPLVIMVLLAQKRIVAGLTAGAVKG